MINLTIPGIPVAKARARVTSRGTYTPTKTKNYEELVKWCYRQQCKGEKLTGPVEIEIILYMLIPKKISQIRRKKKNNNEILPTKKPDWDNMAKSITDALNEMAYTDDSYITDAIVRKRFSDNPRAEVMLREMKAEAIKEV